MKTRIKLFLVSAGLVLNVTTYLLFGNANQAYSVPYYIHFGAFLGSAIIPLAGAAAFSGLALIPRMNWIRYRSTFSVLYAALSAFMFLVYWSVGSLK